MRHRLFTVLGGAAAVCAGHAFDAAGAPRIVGGAAAQAGALPAMTALVRPGMSAAAYHFCGGTLVHPLWVLTAAHCLENLSPGVPLGAVQVDLVIGRTDLAGTDGVRVANSYNVIHPGYDASTIDNDLALVRLAAPVDLPPVRVTAQTFDDPMLAEGTPARVLGWGRTRAGVPTLPTALMEVTVPVTAQTACNEAYAVTANMFCAGYPLGGADSCIGDSGGPALVQSGAGEWIETGVTSFGVGCGLAGSPGVYARLSRYSAWISSVVCDAAQIPPQPQLSFAVAGNSVTGRIVGGAGGNFYLYYAPAAGMSPVRYVDLGGDTAPTATLPSGSHYVAAAVGYQGNCLSQPSALVGLDVP